MVHETKLTLQVTLLYDDSVISEHECQDRFIQNVVGPNLSHLVVTGGMVDDDGVEVPL